MNENNIFTIYRGDCICGKCDCYFPYQGKFCQYVCPVIDGQICGGVSNGHCSNGTCICNPNFQGEDCTCSMSTDNCEFVGIQELCNQKGNCTCNHCECQPGYTGAYCEINKDKNTLCETYRPNVEQAIINNTLVSQKEGMNISVDLTEKNNCHGKFQNYSYLKKNYTIFFKEVRKNLYDYCLWTHF